MTSRKSFALPTLSAVLLFTFFAAPLTSLSAQTATSGDKAETSANTKSSATQPVPREVELSKSLAGVVLRGQWRMTDKSGDLGTARGEEYTIVSAVKDRDDFWIITARIQFGEKDVTFPLRIRILWADDAPVICVTNLMVPGIGIYSARVMIYGDFYAGTWFGKDYGGVMSGQLIRPGTERNAATQPAEATPTK